MSSPPETRGPAWWRQGLLAAALVLAPATAALAKPPSPADDMMPAPKRLGPTQVEAVRALGLRIEAVHWGRERGLGQNGGYIEAFDQATGKQVWLKRVYAIDHDPHMEEDGQDRFIKQMALAADGHTLQVTDERGQRFEIDLASPAEPPCPNNPSSNHKAVPHAPKQTP